jgi:hypothetical protein
LTPHPPAAALRVSTPPTSEETGDTYLSRHQRGASAEDARQSLDQLR